MTTKKNIPAFPVSDIFSGMTLRDYFAAKVLQGVMSKGLPLTSTYPLIAGRVYEMADEMLKARDG
jgi:hypothetical protein